jgi:glutathione S-transferase
MSEIVIYRSIGSRSFTALWMLEELGLPYRSEMRELREKANETAEYLALNPNGFVPLIDDGGVMVSECPAICLYLADRYGYGRLSPKIEDPERGPFLKWLVYATAQLEPAKATRGVPIETLPGGWGPGWRPLPRVLEIIAGALEGRDYLLGSGFSAADVMLGSTLAMGVVAGEYAPSARIDAYVSRLRARPACERAADLTWPPAIFGRR